MIVIEFILMGLFILLWSLVNFVIGLELSRLRSWFERLFWLLILGVVMQPIVRIVVQMFPPFQ